MGNNEPIITDVIFLGAGASIPDGAPCQSQLFSEYFKSANEEDDNDLIERLGAFFEAFFGIDVHNMKNVNTVFPTFEEALGIVELALQREECFKGYSLVSTQTIQPNSNGSIYELRQARNDLIMLIINILEKSLRDKNVHHKILIDRLIAEKRLLRTGFISLNYDILVDNALCEHYDDYHVEYATEFVNFKRVNDFKRADPEKAVNLLKLHGSLNWLYCPVCKSLEWFNEKITVAGYPKEWTDCGICTSYMVPIIIPPTFFKVMSNLHLRKIWETAESVLVNARRIIFCGYSFPDADIHVKYLLKRVEVNTGNTPDIYIVNTPLNQKGKSENEIEGEEVRYQRFFRDSAKVHYTDSSFENFCENGI